MKTVLGGVTSIQSPEESDVLGLRVLHDLVRQKPVQVSDEHVDRQAVLD